VTQCKQCGVNLPDGAKYCLQCGTPVQSDEPPAPAGQPGPLPELDFVQPALTGGMFLGLLSSIPIISAGCCIWVPLGGAIGSVLLLRQRPSGIAYGDGAFVGVLGGLAGAVVGTIIQMSERVIALRFFGTQQQQIEDIFKQFGVAEGPWKDWAMRVFSGEVSALTVGFTFFSNLLIYSLFAMVGGILAIAIINRRKAETTRGTKST
jgi:hypothetical protein